MRDTATKTLIIALALLLLAGCRSTRHTSTRETSSTNVTVATSDTASASQRVDSETDTEEAIETVVETTRVEYYPPTPGDDSTATPAVKSVEKTTKTTKRTASSHGKTSVAGESVVKSEALAVVSDTSSREEQADEQPAEVPAAKKVRAGFVGAVIGAAAVVAIAAYLLIRYRRRTIHRNGP